MSLSVQQIHELVEEERYDEALVLCDQALNAELGSGRSQLWILRSYVHRAMERFDLALADSSLGLAEEPRCLPLILERAVNRIDLGDYPEASADLEHLLLLEHEQSSTYFDVTARMLLTICLNRLGRPQEALATCRQLPTEARTWALDKLWSPLELEAESRALISRS